MPFSEAKKQLTGWLQACKKHTKAWQVTLLVVISLSAVLSVVGVLFKSEVIAALPISNEAEAEPGQGRRFPDNAIDSWKPMYLALTILRGPDGDRLFETLRDFQTAEDDEIPPELAPYANARKFQYPVSSLFPIMTLEAVGLGSIRSLNFVNLAMYLANWAAMIYLVLLLFREKVREKCQALGRPAYQGEALIALLGLGAAMTFYPAYMALSLGNIQIWINLMFTLACIAWIGGRQVLAGVIIACAAAIKPQLAALLLWGILWRRWPFCVGFVSAVIPIGILSVIVFGWHNNVSYFKVLSELSRHGEVCFANESVNGIVHRLIEGGSEDALTNAPATYGPFRPIVYVITLLFGMFIAALAFLPPLMRGKEDPKVADFAAAAVCFTVGSPIVWTFHYGILIPAFAIALKYIVELQSDSRKQDMMLALGIGWCLCASFLPVLRLLYTSPWNILGNPHLYGALLLLFVLIRSGHLWPKRVELPAQLEPVQRALTRRFGLAE